MTTFGSSSNSAFLRPDEVEALRRQHRRFEERRAAAVRAEIYTTRGSTWDDTDWWSLQLGRPAFGNVVPLRETAPPPA